MLNWVGVEESMRVKLWIYVVNNATQHDAILTTRYRSRNPYKLFYGDQPKYISNLRRFGETGTVKTLIKGNMIDNRGFVGMFVGYPADHAENTFLMMNIKTKRTVITRSVEWYNESYGETMKLKENEKSVVPVNDDNSDIETNDEYIILDIGGIEEELSNKENKSRTENETIDITSNTNEEDGLGQPGQNLFQPIEEEVVFESEN